MGSGQVRVKPTQKQTAQAERLTLLRVRTDVRAGKGWCDDCMRSCVSNKGCDGRNGQDREDCYNNCKADWCSTFCPN